MQLPVRSGSSLADNNRFSEGTIGIGTEGRSCGSIGVDVAY